MKKNEFQIEAKAPKPFMLLSAALSLGFVCLMSGCATSAALKLAQEKSWPPSTYTKWGINRVTAAVEMENGDIAICLELFESGNADKPFSYAINLPRSGLLNDETGLKKIDFKENHAVGHPDGDTPGSYIAEYLYPMTKAEKGCQKLEFSKYPADSIIPFVELTLPENDRSRLYTFLSELEMRETPGEKLYEVKFLQANMADENITNDNRATEYSDALLIYRPPGTDQERVDPIAIAGGYESEDDGTDLYYLLVPPAFVVDAIVVMAILAAYRPM